jgi:hypothetical protein
MPISSQSLFHFTNSLDAVEGILREGFKVGYCREEHEIDGVRTLCHVPMVSFCEIPLSQVKDHIFKYGRYGIGLSRAWAKSKGLNPVIYLQQDSYLSGYLREAAHFFLIQSRENAGQITEQHLSALKALGQILAYTKNYEGSLHRKNETRKNYRFSDEREWRFVPTSERILTMMSEETFNSDIGQRLKHTITEGFRMPVQPSDISYILVSQEADLDRIIAAIRSNNSKIEESQIDRLLTRILTVEQIESDF